MNGVTELGYLGLGVRDLGAWKDFASQVLGFEVVDGDVPGTCLLRMDYWHYRFLLREDGTDDVAFAGWRVAGWEALEAIERALRSAEVPYHVASEQEAADRHVLGLLRLQDPAGVQTEVFYGPRIEPGHPVYPGRRMHGGFVTGEGGLGHLVVGQPDPALAEAFYKRLGLAGSIGSRTQLPGGQRVVTFMNCNARQHSLGFLAANRPRRMNHVMTELTRLEDVGLARDIVAARGTPVLMELGQHHNDRAVSFYVDTPSGWAWEIGWNVVHPSAQAEYATRDIWGHARRPG